MIKVLCILLCKSKEGHITHTWRDSVMIEVSDSRQIIMEVKYKLANREAHRHRFPGLYPRPFDVRLVSYMPENGKASFKLSDTYEARSWRPETEARLH